MGNTDDALSWLFTLYYGNQNYALKISLNQYAASLGPNKNEWGTAGQPRDMFLFIHCKANIDIESQTFYSLYQIDCNILGPVCVTKNPWFVDKKWFTPGTTPTIYKHNRIKW